MIESKFVPSYDTSYYVTTYPYEVPYMCGLLCLGLTYQCLLIGTFLFCSEVPGKWTSWNSEKLDSLDMYQVRIQDLVKGGPSF